MMSSNRFSFYLRISLDGLKFLKDVRTLIVDKRAQSDVVWTEKVLVTTPDDNATVDSLDDALLWALSRDGLEQIAYELEPKTSTPTRDISKVRITLYRDKKGRVDIPGDGLDAPGLASAIRELVPGWSTRGRRWIRRLPHFLAARLTEILVGVIAAVLGGLLLAALL